MSLCSHLYTPIELLLCEEFFELKVLHGYREVLILLARCFNYLVLLMSSRKDGDALSKFVFPLFIVSVDVPLWSHELCEILLRQSRLSVLCSCPSSLTSWEEFASPPIQVNNKTSKDLIASKILPSISTWTNTKVSNNREALLQRSFFWLEFCWKLSLLLRNRNLLILKKDVTCGQFFKSECP